MNQIQLAPQDDAFHVLVVDDDRRLRDLLSIYLQTARGSGYRLVADG